MLCIYFYTISNNFCELNVYDYITMVRWTWIPKCPNPSPADAVKCWAAQTTRVKAMRKNQCITCFGLHPKATRKAARSHLEVEGGREWKVQRFLFLKVGNCKNRATKILKQALSDLLAGFWSFDSFDVLLGVPHMLPDPGTCNFSVLFCREQARQLPRNCGVSFLLDTGNAGSAWKKVVSPPSKASLV